MVERTVTIYEVPNTYFTNPGRVSISSVRTMVIVDDDQTLNPTAATDTGSPQVIRINGVQVTNYNFAYYDNIRVNVSALTGAGGTADRVITFQVTLAGVTRTFLMNDTGATIPGMALNTRINYVSHTPFTGTGYNNFPCFAEGTLIETADGERPIETLRPGDLVMTLDNGLQPVAWIGSSHLSARGLREMPQARPVRIAKGAMGGGLPRRDLILSPQHRVLLSGWKLELLFALPEALSPAIALLGQAGVSLAAVPDGVTYWHMMFDRHEIVLSDGLATESFMLGDTIRDAMDEAQLAEILALFPELAADPAAREPARPCLRRSEAACLFAKAA